MPPIKRILFDYTVNPILGIVTQLASILAFIGIIFLFTYFLMR